MSKKVQHQVSENLKKHNNQQQKKRDILKFFFLEYNIRVKFKFKN